MEKLLLVAGVQPSAPSSRPAVAISPAQRSRRRRSMTSVAMIGSPATRGDDSAYYTEGV
ncbi:hypothetical protein [Dokdonella sp.]|uniref:hypothetical protein n=1 Tax=Dokdonella sp. TaxID=2291710 RepID=UPI0037842C27